MEPAECQTAQNGDFWRESSAFYRRLPGFNAFRRVYFRSARFSSAAEAFYWVSPLFPPNGVFFCCVEPIFCPENGQLSTDSDWFLLKSNGLCRVSTSFYWVFTWCGQLNWVSSRLTEWNCTCKRFAEKKQLSITCENPSLVRIRCILVRLFDFESIRADFVEVRPNAIHISPRYLVEYLILLSGKSKVNNRNDRRPWIIVWTRCRLRLLGNPFKRHQKWFRSLRFYFSCCGFSSFFLSFFLSFSLSLSLSRFFLWLLFFAFVFRFPFFFG